LQNPNKLSQPRRWFDNLFDFKGAFIKGTRHPNTFASKAEGLRWKFNHNKDTHIVL